MDLETGEALKIHEHARTVAADPALFRIEPREVAQLSPFAGRARLRVHNLRTPERNLDTTAQALLQSLAAKKHLPETSSRDYSGG